MAPIGDGRRSGRRRRQKDGTSDQSDERPHACGDLLRTAVSTIVCVWSFECTWLGLVKCDEGGERRVQEEAVAFVEWRAEQQRETTVDGLNILQILARRTPNPEK